jgi:predicted transcriptional regulator
MTETQGIKLDDQIRTRLKRLGEQRERSPHWLMRTAIVEYLDREERYEQERQEDMARWERYQLTGDAVPHKAVAKWLSETAKGKSRSCPK